MPKTIRPPLDPKQDVYRVLTRDQCRDLRVIRPKDVIGEFNKKEWQLITALAASNGGKSKKEDEARRQQERKALEEDFLKRKAEFEGLDATQASDPLETEVKKEQAAKSSELRAQLERDGLENEDTVRFFNDCLNSVLVRAVRDRQVRRTEQIKQLAQKEEFRLDNACRKDANLGFTIGRKLDEYRQEEEMRYSAALKDQLRAKEEERLLEKEQKATEGRLAQEYARRLQQEEVEEGFKRQAENREKTKKLIEANTQALEAKKEARLHDIRMDHLLAEHQKKKIAEEEKKDAEAAEAKRLRDLEHYNNLKKQERALDMKAIEDEKKAQRAVYQADRDWRLKETSKALKEKREQAELKKVIEYQRDLNIRKKAHELEQEQSLFKQTQERLVREAAKAEEERSGTLSKRKLMAETLRKQIAEREKERWKAVQARWNEGKDIKQNQKQLDEKIGIYMNEKMGKAEAAGIPKEYLQDILRHMTWTGYLPKPDSPFASMKNKDQVSKLIRHFS